jgi:hypothetical protein
VGSYPKQTASFRGPAPGVSSVWQRRRRREEDKPPALFYVLEPSESPRMSQTNNPSPKGRSGLFRPLNEINDTITQLVSLHLKWAGRVRWTVRVTTSY